MASSFEPVEGAIDHVVYRLVRWSLNAPRGIAYVSFESENARRIAEARWADALRQQGQTIQTLDLWSHRDVDEAIETLLSTIRERSASVLSVTGFGPLLQGLGNDWRALNYRREQWYEPGTRQVWWVPARFDQAFRQYAPDLYSWFLVKEPLTEQAIGEGGMPRAEPTASLDVLSRNDGGTAMRESDAIVERIQNGFRKGVPSEYLVDLVVAAARPLLDAGQGGEAQRRATSMLDRLFSGHSAEGLRQRLNTTEGPSLCMALARAGAFFASRTAYEAASRLLDMLGEQQIAALPPSTRADAAQAFGDVALAHSDHAAARARYEEALPLYRRIGDLLGEANCVRSLGDVALAYSDHVAAQARYEEALPLYRRIGDLLGEGNCVHSLGDMALRRLDHDAARALYEEALPLFRRISDVLGESNCIAGLGDVALDRSDHSTARARYEEALILFRRIGNLLGEANCVTGLGDVARAENDDEVARRRYETALALYARIPEPYSIGLTYLFLSRLHNLSDEERRDFRQKTVSAWRLTGQTDLITRHFPDEADASEDVEI